MNICVLGATGLLGGALLRETEKRGMRVFGCARKGAAYSFDIKHDTDLIAFIASHNFDVVINACAIVDHQFCDLHPGTAYAVNARPSALLAKMASERNFKYVYISTDGYFSGGADSKHDESAPIILLNEYARTKYAGEVFSLTNSNTLVIRTNIVGFRAREGQPTFIEWALHLLKEQCEMTLFTDYFTSSIATSQLAQSLFDLLSADPVGIYNIGSSEVFSKAVFIKRLAKEFGLSTDKTRLGTVRDLPSMRPDSLGLNVGKAEKLLGYKLPTMDAVIKQLKRDYDEH